ncbi:MAG: hypothetical protein WAR79_16555 [Melioribacteraceae bacterium]
MQIFESAISYLCKLFSAKYYKNNDQFSIQFDNKDIVFVSPEFNEEDFVVSISTVVYEYLRISKVEKLKGF